MKKTTIALLAAVAVSLSACENEVTTPTPTEEVTPNEAADECPRADGQPCK